MAKDVTASPLIVSAFLALIALGVGLIIRPKLNGKFGGFGGDASTIQAIMSSPFSAADLGYGSYSVIADFYTRIGMVDTPTAASALGALIGSAVLGCVLIRVRGVHGGQLSLALALLTPLMIGIYEAAYTKEIIISLGMLVVVLLPRNLLGEALVIGTLCVLGAQYRTYWLIVAVLYVIVRLALHRWSLSSRRSTHSVRRIVGLIGVLAILTGLAVWIGTGAAADSFRTDANDTSVRINDTGSLITRFIEAPEPLGGVLNSTMSTLFFIVPLPMLAKASPYYLLIGLLFALIWTSALRAAAVAGGGIRGNPSSTKDQRLLARFTALPLAFLIVQGLFEPDWGSALRHATPLLPLIVGAVALAERHKAPPDAHRESPPASPPISPPMSPQSSSPRRPWASSFPLSQLQRTAMASPQTTQSTSYSARNVLAQYLSYLRKWWWMLVVGLLVGALAGWSASALMTKHYTAKAQLYVGTASTGGSGDAYQGALLSQKQVGSYAAIANSRALGQQVVDDLQLNRTADDVTSMIKASAYRDTVILNLQVVSSDANLSRDIANSAAVQLQEMVRELNDLTSPRGPSGAPQLAVLNEAVTPGAPSSPKPVENSVIGAILGIILSALIAVVRGLTDRRVTTTSSVRTIVNAPLIGTIDFSETLAHQHTLDFSAAPTLAAEQFRTLRTNLRFLDVDNAPTVLAVTSGMPSEGKSTLAVNLALSLADDGEAVCLVDADLRNPSMAKYINGNLHSAVGLSTALTGSIEIDDVIQATATDGLSVITAGPTPPNPAELLGSRRFDALLSHLATNFDHVILDTSPVLPVTDGALVSSSADGVILTICHNTTTIDQLSSARNNLTAVNSRILGTVLTMAPESKGKGYHRYGYGSTVAAHMAQPSGALHSHETTHANPDASSSIDGSHQGRPTTPHTETPTGVEH